MSAKRDVSQSDRRPVGKEANRNAGGQALNETRNVKVKSGIEDMRMKEVGSRQQR
jgi:hypothetical protein